MDTQDFVPVIYRIKGDYYILKMVQVGLNAIPKLTKISKSARDSILKQLNSDESSIVEYADFVLFPENDPRKYSREIDLGDGLINYNLYECPNHPKGTFEYVNEHGNFPNIEKLIMHIAPPESPFEDSKYTYLQLVVDYLAIMWRFPKERLPVLVLVSKERSTGKSTFLEFLGLLFQSNAKCLSVGDLDDPNNSIWGTGTVILVDEANIPTRMQAVIRNQTTSSVRKIKEKYEQAYEVANYSKFILASNDIENFTVLDEEENRYFVIEIKPFEANSEIPRFIDRIKEEIPQFLDYMIHHHQIVSPKSTRFWFNYEDYKTPALFKMVKKKKTGVVEAAIKSYFLDKLDGEWKSNKDSDVIDFSISSFLYELSLGKSSEKGAMEVLPKMGFKKSDTKVRFECMYRGKTLAFKYTNTIGELRDVLISDPGALRLNFNLPPKFGQKASTAEVDCRTSITQAEISSVTRSNALIPPKPALVGMVTRSDVSVPESGVSSANRNLQVPPQPSIQGLGEAAKVEVDVPVSADVQMPQPPPPIPSRYKQ